MILKSPNRGISKLLISPDIELLHQVCDRIVYLEEGSIVRVEEN